MHILTLLLLGLTVGAGAPFLVPLNLRTRWVVSSLLGGCGALLGALLGQAAGVYREGEPTALVLSALGATALVMLFQASAVLRAAP